MKKYDNYKDSGIEWIGEIPEHWESTKLKFFGESIIGIIYSPDDVVTTGEGILVLRSSNIQDGKLAFEDCVFVNKEVQEKYLTKDGDILLCARNGSAHLVGKAAYIDKQNEGITFGAFMSIVRSELDKYLFYFFNSQVFKAQTGLFSTSTINQLTSSTLNNMFISFPRDKQEQTAIANYLDRKTTEIDQLIADKKRLLELYEEEKTAIINQAVTQGINPDVPMKDSGIEWLGEIPEHWEVKRLSWCFEIIGSGTTPKAGSEEYYSNGEFNWLLTGDLTDGDILETSKKVTQKALDDHTSLKRYPVNSVVMAMYGATIGKLGILKIPTTVNQACCVMGNAIHLHYQFAFFLLLAARNEIINMSYGGGQPNISQELIKSFRVQVPPIEEQKAIVHHIETKCALIDIKTENTKKLIDLLTEYRTALISEVVTGKIKVTE
ncbi:restriction endonuclease subunit S [Gelidibacter japonicus]|uniref:restriction endonuclease subunit S n=1 Tax=Gelidibacter japonicus TaxID=1962232 RepID=UPI003A91489C